MARMQREKGKRFERFIADEIRKALPQATVHRTIQAHAAFQADVTIEGIAPRLARDAWLELTDSRKPDVSAKLAQAERDAEAAGAERMPIVVWKKTGSRSVYASMRLRVLGRLLGFEAPSASLEMVTIGWPVVLDAFIRAERVRAKMAEKPIGLESAAAIKESILAACRVPPQLSAVPDQPQPPPHVDPEIPRLNYVPTPPGFIDHRIIAGQRWDIKYSPELRGMERAFGATYIPGSLIIIDSTQAPEQMRKVLLHELIHACFATGAQHFLNEDEEEASVRLLTTTMHSMLPRDWWLL